ncbi:MAG: B12-binding domain-containing radical SAM protein [Bacteroidota bacterium]
MKEVVLITPPFTQLNTPYPATAYLKGFLNTKGISSYQIDLGIEVINAMFCSNGLRTIFDLAFENETIQTDNAQRIFALKEDYIGTVESVILFLQGKNDTLARQICNEVFLPQAARFNQLDDLEWAFGNMGIQDKAKHLATLYLEDLSDFITECIDPNFGFSRYAERLGLSANSFDDLYEELNSEPTFVDTITLQLLDQSLRENAPKLVCFSVPFPGNLYSAFRCAKYIKQHFPSIKVCMGGGFPNTELRSIEDTRVFEFFDFITLDDGELPIELLVNYCRNTNLSAEFKRTFYLENNVVVYSNTSERVDYKQAFVGTPDYSDLHLQNYISVIQMANPMHSLWSDGRWNKLTMAHGCYWGKCTFCDVSLDYIKVYEPIVAKILVDRMEELIAQTGERGFHFVDEAAPPALMRSLAIEIIRRKLTVTWWTNIRFEKSFTRDLAVLLAKSGCIAVSGGLEVASDRLLALIQKGITVEQVARVTKNLSEAGIMVHAYLMYGYPTQTIQETVDSLEMVRQLFEAGIVQSGFWHQFALTAHSPIGLHPEEFGLQPDYKTITFADNDIQFKDSTGIDHTKFSFGLKKSLFNFLHGIGFEVPLQQWFEFKIPRTLIAPNYIEQCIASEPMTISKPNIKPLWLGSMPVSSIFTKSKRGETWEMMQLIIHDKRDCLEINLDKLRGEWLLEKLATISIFSTVNPTISELKADFESNDEDFELFWYSKPLNQLREAGLLV